MDDAETKALRLRMYFLCSECANLIDLAEGQSPTAEYRGRGPYSTHSRGTWSLVEVLDIAE